MILLKQVKLYNKIEKAEPLGRQIGSAFLLTENLATFGIILKDISYDEQEHTKSCTALYGSVEEFRKAMMSTQQHVISKGIITDLVSIKDAKDKITNISMYKANKLIDKAEKSIEKLKHL